MRAMCWCLLMLGLVGCQSGPRWFMRDHAVTGRATYSDDLPADSSGKSGSEIEAIEMARFKSGQYHAPSRAGVAYMLSPMRYRIDEHGGVTRTTSNPHLMFYGPNLTDSDIGGVRGAFVFVNRVGPDGMMIVPVGQKEREAIVSDAHSLIAQVEQAIGYQPSR